ncbi:MAG: glycosyltransferase family 2 protein [Elusimicrobiales bacterium]
MNISFAIIGHNEAHLLRECLESIKDIAFEIVYLDCQSDDNSVDIAREFGAKVFVKENNFNLNVNKQFAIDNCSGEWIFYIDPDERLTEGLKNEITITLKDTDSNGFIIPRRNYYFGKWLRYGGKYPDRQLRLFRRGKGRFECKSIHERIKVVGKIGYMKNAFEHIVIENTGRLIIKMNSYAYRGAYEALRLGIKPSEIISKALKKFFINYFLKGGFLDGKKGFFVSLIDLFNGYLCYYKYMELAEKKI